MNPSPHKKEEKRNDYYKTANNKEQQTTTIRTELANQSARLKKHTHALIPDPHLSYPTASHSTVSM